MKRILAATAVAAVLIPAASEATTPADGYIYTRSPVSNLTEGCIAEGSGGVYVGIGPALGFPATGGTRSIVFLTDGGEEVVIATGLNAIGDCWFDREANLLYVTDNGGNYSGAVTGDTVFVFAGDAVADPATSNELLPAGSIPFASSITPFGGNLLVSDAAGNGNGSIIEIDLSGDPATMSTFAGGFDYAGGIATSGDSVIIAQSHEETFDNSLYEYDADGDLVQTLSGPTYDHGSIDVATLEDGSFAVTGNDTIVRVTSAGATSPLVTGLVGGNSYAAFGGAVTTRDDHFRLAFLASSFTGHDDDKSVHRLVPIEHLVPGRGMSQTECVHEFYGIELVQLAPGKRAKFAVCEDGAACDADGAANGGCTFPLGMCVNVPDERFPDCTPSGISDFKVIASRPAGSPATLGGDDLHNDLPITEPYCAFTDGIRVELRGDGTRPGRGLFKVRATRTGTPVRYDTDAVRLLCQPAA